MQTSRSSNEKYLPDIGPEYIEPSKQAVIWVKKASSGSNQWVEKKDEGSDKQCTKAQFEWYMLFKKTKYPNYWAKILLVLVALFERPSECRGTAYQCAHADMALYSWNLPVIAMELRMSIALVLYLMIGARLVVRWKSLGDLAPFVQRYESMREGQETHGWFRLVLETHGWFIFQSICVTIGTMFCVLTMCGGKEGGFCWLITILCRPLILIAGTKKIRNTFTTIVKSVVTNDGAVAVVIATLFLSIWVFVWMGMVLFARTPEGRKDFFSWADGVASMWILFTTANDPNDWIPAYTSYKISVFFFIIFLILMLYLLLNLLLANVYQAYKSSADEALHVQMALEKDSLAKAFICLRGDNDGITPDAWAAFVADSCDPYIGTIHAGAPEAKEYNLKRCMEVLKKCGHHLLDSYDPNDEIGYPLFENVMRVIISKGGMYVPSEKEKDHKFYSCCPPWVTSFFLRGFSLCGFKLDWRKIVDVVILITVPLTIWASISFADAKYDQDFRRFLSFRLLFAAACMYAVGLSIFIVGVGFERFWHRNHIQHRYDFFNVYLLVAAELVYFFVWPTQTLARVIIILHLFRGARLLAYITPLKDLYVFVSLLVPSFWQMFLVLFCTYYVFSVVGQYLFGGLIFSTNPVLAGTNFAQAGFWPLNFNDLPSGFVTLFALMIVNNWYELAQAFMFVTHSNLVSIYFLIFFVICNLIVLNIVMALIIDCNSVVDGMVQRQARHLQKSKPIRQNSRGEDDDDDEPDDLEEGLGVPTSDYVMRRAFGCDDLGTPKSSDDEAESVPAMSPRSEKSSGLQSSERSQLMPPQTPRGYSTFDGEQQHEGNDMTRHPHKKKTSKLVKHSETLPKGVGSQSLSPQ